MVFYLQMPFREEFLIRKGKQYYPQTLEFVCPLCLILTSEGRTNTWWWLNYHCTEINFFKSNLLLQSCCAICMDSTEAVPIPWLWLTVMLQEI